LLKRSLPYTSMPEIDMRVMGFAAAVALAVSLLSGAWPALQTPVGNLARALRLGGRGFAGGQLAMRRAIVVAEVALSLVLVCGGMLLFRSLAKLQQIETGIQTENVITTTVSLPARSYPTTGNAAAFYEAASARLRAIPGVQQVALSSHLPLRWIGNGEAIEIKGVTTPVNIRFKRVDPGYFPTLGIQVVAGRGIAEGDRAGAKRVVVINEVLAKRFTELSGIANPIGQQVALYCPRYGRVGTDTENVEIAGIIRNERVSGPAATTPPVVYVPLAQVPAQDVVVLARTMGKAGDAAAGIREAVRQVDAKLPLGEFTTMEEVRARTLSAPSQAAWLIGGFAALAALLAAVGLYGVLAQAVTQQMRETGIRLALGAQPRQVVGRVLLGTLGLVGAGLAIGLGGAFAMTRVLRGMLFEVTPSDPVSIAGACIVMLLLGVVAGLAPAGRAARVDPVIALREEG
jgi:predicted permease